MFKDKKKSISIIIPVYNEAEHVPQVYMELCNVWAQLRDRYNYELIFVNDGSTDDSLTLIERLAAEDAGVRYVDLSRNFGKEAAMTAGLREAHGEAAVIMDADLQHPPVMIPIFIEHWERGAEVVVGVRSNGGGASVLRRLGSWFYRSVLKLLTSGSVVARATDFRLLDRMVVNEFVKMTERNRMTRGLIDWLGFRKEYVKFEAGKRQHGKPRYRYGKLIHLAVYSFVSESLLPLKLAGYLGLLTFVFSVGLGSFTFVDRFILGHTNFSGPFMSAVFNMFLTSITLMSLGFISLYIGGIRRDTQGRPLYIIRKKSK